MISNVEYPDVDHNQIDRRSRRIHSTIAVFVGVILIILAIVIVPRLITGDENLKEGLEEAIEILGTMIVGWGWINWVVYLGTFRPGALPSIKDADTLAIGLVDRLEKEIIDQDARAFNSIVIGIVIAAFGLLLLGLSLSSALLDSRQPQFWRVFASKVSFTIVLNLIAFFFFESYRRSLQEMRYYHNELTNVQSRLLAIALTQCPDQTEMRSTTIKALLDVERNFILRKGETTAEIALREHDRAEIDRLIQLMNVAQGRLPSAPTP